MMTIIRAFLRKYMAWKVKPGENIALNLTTILEIYTRRHS